jgi:2-oxoacid:acceptor oxidoreductase gamma subunit (pyruvate/2-ketoisovalerate family)
VTEIRWHARAGQGAKTAAQLLAEALLQAGKSVQAFPEYGPERRGAPMRAYTRVSDRPIRRHDAVTEPDVVAVLEAALLRELDVTEGMPEGGVVVLAAEEKPAGLTGRWVVCVPARENVNVALAGAVGALVGAGVDDLAAAAVRLLGRKVPAESLRASVEEGYACAS